MIDTARIIKLEMQGRDVTPDGFQRLTVWHQWQKARSMCNELRLPITAYSKRKHQMLLPKGLTQNERQQLINA